MNFDILPKSNQPNCFPYAEPTGKILEEDCFENNEKKLNFVKCTGGNARFTEILKETQGIGMSDKAKIA